MNEVHRVTNEVRRNPSHQVSNLGIDMDGNGVPAADVVAEASICTNGNGRACARATVLDTVNDVTVRSCRKACLESR